MSYIFVTNNVLICDPQWCAEIISITDVFGCSMCVSIHASGLDQEKETTDMGKIHVIRIHPWWNFSHITIQCWHERWLTHLPWEIWLGFIWIGFIFNTNVTITCRLIFSVISYKWVPQNPIDGKSVLVQEITCCHKATNHNPSQCLSRSMSPYGVTRPQREESMGLRDYLVSHQIGRNILMTATQTWSMRICGNGVTT